MPQGIYGLFSSPFTRSSLIDRHCFLSNLYTMELLKFYFLDFFLSYICLFKDRKYISIEILLRNTYYDDKTE